MKKGVLRCFLLLLLVSTVITACTPTQPANHPSKRQIRKELRRQVKCLKFGCSKQDSTITSDQTVIRDSIIYVPVPITPSKDSIPLNGINSEVSRIAQEYFTCDAWVQNGVLYHYYKPTGKKFPVKYVTKVQVKTNKQYIKVPFPVDRYNTYVPWLIKMLAYIGGAGILGGIIYIATLKTRWFMPIIKYAGKLITKKKQNK